MPANFINTSGNITANSGNFSVLTANSGLLDQLIFNTGLDDPNLTAGQLQWNETEGTLDLGLNDNYAMHLGEELLYRVRNVTGTTLLAGQPVYASGLSPGSNNRIEVNLYVADGSVREIQFMGLMTEDLTDNGNNGFATQFGYIRGVDTRGDAATYGTTNKLWTTGEPAWLQGDILYVHPTVPGKLTKVEPKHSISVAIITNVAQNGKIFVRPTSYGHLDDNHDVAVSGATNGQFLQYNSVTDYWVPSSSGNFATLQVNGTAVPTGTGIGQFLPVWNNISSLGISNIYETTSDQQGYISINNPSIGSNNILGLYSPNAGDTKLYMHSTYGGAYIVQVPNDPFTPDNLWWGLSTSSTWIGSRGDFNPMEKISFYVKATGIAGNPTEKMTIGLSGTVINDLGGNYDFRVEGDNDANLLFTDASTDRVGIGTSSPSYKLDVVGTGNFSQNLLVNGTGVSLSGHTHTVNDITNWDEAVDDRVNNLLVGTSGINISYNDNANTLTVAVDIIDCGEVLAPPNAPTGLSATPSNQSLALTWTAPAYVGSTPITGYTVEYTPSGGSASIVNTNSTSTSYTLTGLANGTSYTVRVRAINSAGNGTYSSTTTGTPFSANLTVSVSTTGSGTSSDPYLVNTNDFSVTAGVAGTLYYRAPGSCPDCNWALFLNGVFKLGGPDQYLNQSMTASQVINITAGVYTNSLPRSIYFVPT
jgi:hypothetical protein